MSEPTEADWLEGRDNWREVHGREQAIPGDESADLRDLIYHHEYIDGASGTMRDAEGLRDAILAAGFRRVSPVTREELAGFLCVYTEKNLPERFCDHDAVSCVDCENCGPMAGALLEFLSEVTDELIRKAKFEAWEECTRRFIELNPTLIPVTPGEGKEHE